MSALCLYENEHVNSQAWMEAGTRRFLHFTAGRDQEGPIRHYWRGPGHCPTTLLMIDAVREESLPSILYPLMIRPGSNRSFQSNGQTDGPC